MSAHPVGNSPTKIHPICGLGERRCDVRNLAHLGIPLPRSNSVAFAAKQTSMYTAFGVLAVQQPRIDRIRGRLPTRSSHPSPGVVAAARSTRARRASASSRPCASIMTTERLKVAGSIKKIYVSHLGSYLIRQCSNAWGEFCQSEVHPDDENSSFNSSKLDLSKAGKLKKRL